jgi:hypothetical protein
MYDEYGDDYSEGGGGDMMMGGGGMGGGRGMFNNQMGAFGFGGRRSNILLSVALHVVLWVTIIYGIVLFAVFLAYQNNTTIVWYDTPYWWLHAFATGVFFVSTFDTMQLGMFLFRPSVSATILMALSLVTNVVAGYFYIIDLWIPCIFGWGSLDTQQEIMCDDERTAVWFIWWGAWMGIVMALLGFFVALWDAATMLSASSNFSGLSGAIRGVARRASSAAPKLLQKAKSAAIPSASHIPPNVYPYGGPVGRPYPPPPVIPHEQAVYHRAQQNGAKGPLSEV